MNRLRILLLAAVLAMTAVVVVGTANTASAAPGVDPAAVELTLEPGESASLPVNVTTPEVAPRPDIVFLGDTTGSMDPVLANVGDNIGTIIDTVRAAQPDARFAVAEYKDRRDGPRAFRVNTPLTDDAAAVRDGVRRWLYTVGGGGQPWTDFINAHHQLATGAVGFRPGGTRIVAWFGDARSHDPSLGHTLAATRSALLAAGVRVVAVPVLGTGGGGLDALGQASSITKATGGVLMPEQAADQVAQALLDGVRALEVPVTPRPTCDAALSLGTSPAQRRVRGGTAASFVESVAVAPGTAAGTYRCTVDFLVNGVGAGLTQTVTVHVRGGEPELRIGDVTVTEGDSGTTPATFTVSLAMPARTEVTVRWATAPGTAGQADFTEGSGLLTFPPGTLSRQVTVPVVGDLAPEPDETFAVHLTAPRGAAIADGSGAGTIVDDDPAPPAPELAIGDVTVPEGDTGRTPAELTVRLDRPAEAAVSARWTTTPGSAGAEDFTRETGVVTIPAGATGARVTVRVVGDTAEEAAEEFTVALDQPDGAVLADGRGSVGIANDDPGSPGSVPAVRIGDATAAEGDAGPAAAALTVVLDRASATPVTVPWATAPGTAGPGDFEPASGTVTFEPGTTSALVEVLVGGDTGSERDETFTVALGPPDGAVLADEAGLVTIRDDDAATEPPDLSIGDVSVPEGDSGSVPATLTVTLDRPSGTPVTVSWATAPGTADPADFTESSGEVTFAPGETSAEVAVAVVGDTTAEGEETFTVTLSDPDGARPADPEGVVTIVDDDDGAGGPAVSVADAAVAEGDTGETPVAVRLTLDRAGTSAVSVRWATTSRTADPTDFRDDTGTVTFAPGQLSATVQARVVGDTSVEGDETFTVTLSEPDGAVLADAEAVVTILDDDGAPRPALTIGDVSVPESGPARLTVRLSERASAAVTARWATADGTATAPGDYTAGTGTVTIPEGADTGTVEVALVDDPDAEPAETFRVTLSDPDGATLADAEAVVTIGDDDGAGTFGCTSSALNLLGTRPAVANPPVTPCVDDSRTAVLVRLGLGLLRVEADGLTARTDAAPGGVSATGGLATTRISTIGLSVEVEAITATATATCVGGEAEFSGSSAIAALRVNGVRIPIGSAPVTVPLLIGSLELNSTEVTEDGVVQRAFALRTLLGDVVIGEARTTARDDPC